LVPSFLLPSVKVFFSFFSVPFRFFFLAFYCVFSFCRIGFYFYRPSFLLFFFDIVLFLFLWLMWFHLYPTTTCLRLKGLVVVVVVNYKNNCHDPVLTGPVDGPTAWWPGVAHRPTKPTAWWPMQVSCGPWLTGGPIRGFRGPARGASPTSGAEAAAARQLGSKSLTARYNQCHHRSPPWPRRGGRLDDGRLRVCVLAEE
jgi:hypothetical protein